MRTIKFRQRLENSKWHYWGFTELGGFTGPIQIDQIPSDQFTGLTDKNGKEIYQGDFLIDGDSEPCRHQIIWDEWKAGFELLTMNDDGWEAGLFDYLAELIETKDKPRLTDFEVIGNIYENPELRSVSDSESDATPLTNIQ
jgi:hypothetical protein